MSLIGPRALAIDLTELDETDCLHAPESVLAEAQEMAARAFGADQTYFLVNGSTVGLHAMVMAACAQGEAIALSRASHLSVFGALVLSGARPVFTGRAWDETWQLPGVVTPEDAVTAFEDPDVRALLVTRPDYFGRSIPLEPLSAACRAHDRLLLVDEAHGAHLGLEARLPMSALKQGADAVVQSTHKLGSALTQASMLHLKGTRLEPMRVRRMLRLLQTTSPSYLLMASLDGARRRRETKGAEDWRVTLDMGQGVRDRLSSHGIATLGPDHGPACAWDPAKLIVDLAGTGHDGFKVADFLHDRAHVQVELATPRYLGALVTPGNTPADLDRLVETLLQALCEPANEPPPFPAMPDPGLLVELPRTALLGATRRVPLAQALGEVSAELICPYPPGIPVVLPGERLSRQVLEYLEALRVLGASFVGPEDPSLETLQVCSARPASIPSSPAIAASSS